MRKVLLAAKCSQMSNPSKGTGSGGDRCTEACAAIIAKTYHVPLPGMPPIDQLSGEQVMYWFTQQLNKGSNVSALENAAWINSWMTQHGGPGLANKHGPSFADVKAMVDAGHIGVGGFNYYENLRLPGGVNPYNWTSHGLIGHVLIIVGYDDTAGTVIVHDPLRADPGGQPADYAWSSFGPAGFADLSVVQGKSVSSSLGVIDAVGNLTQIFAADDNVANLFVFIDQMEQVANPFDAGSTAQQDNLLGTTFTDPMSWATLVGKSAWGDIQAIGFRLFIFLLGAYLIMLVVKSWLPMVNSSPQAGGQVQTAAQIAMLA